MNTFRSIRSLIITSGLLLLGACGASMEFKDHTPSSQAGGVSVDQPNANTTRITLSKSAANFDTDSWTLDSQSAQKLEQLSKLLTTYAFESVSVAGHADRTGPESWNQTLAKRRANTAAKTMARAGLKIESSKITGYGSSRPINPNNPKLENREDRRVEITIEGLSGTNLEQFESEVKKIWE